MGNSEPFYSILPEHARIQSFVIVFDNFMDFMPSYFLVYSNSLCEGGIFLPKMGLQELMRCNLSRFLQTGKYVPFRTMVEANDRVSNLVKSAQSNLRSPTFSKLQLDQELARMINLK
jgi:hypothetical protein